ncbi:MAG: hypothetical protein FWE03_00650 [Firmicutes bacterium]|nr:hypothetical protein [Bacillota bacterium]
MDVFIGMKNIFLLSSALTYIVYAAIGLAAFILACSIVRLVHWLLTKNKHLAEEYAPQEISLSATSKYAALLPSSEILGLDNFNKDIKQREIVIKITSDNNKTEDNRNLAENLEKILTRQDIFDRIEFMRRDPEQYPTLPYYKDKDEIKNISYDYMMCGERVFCFIESEDSGITDTEERKLLTLKNIGFRLPDGKLSIYKDLELIKIKNDFYLLDTESRLKINKKQIYELVDTSYNFTNKSFYVNRDFDDETELKKGEKEIEIFNAGFNV